MSPSEAAQAIKLAANLEGHSALGAGRGKAGIPMAAAQFGQETRRLRRPRLLPYEG